jgi:hypothetical protein
MTWENFLLWTEYGAGGQVFAFIWTFLLSVLIMIGVDKLTKDESINH